ncbi:GH07323p [Strongyloides ratti]|uniref:GH07323p n=1 Tax=Strongyloides ratti TaxID=34506 RepID=A0A090LES8_STRRB|nr:GH07323p [Strongyloides ratti]CEF68271.1 GH07323p [Strongyloides ratti]
MIHPIENDKKNQKIKSKKEKNIIVNFFNINKVNVICTFFLLIIFSYFFLIGLFDRNIYDPLNKLIDEKKINNVTINNTNLPTISYSDGILLIFFGLSIGIVFGYILQFIYIPALVGYLITGVIIRNVQVFKNIFILPLNWSSSIRLMAFVIIMARCGTGLNMNALKKYWLLSGAIGIISTIFEGISISLVAIFIFNFPSSYGILFGFLLSATSPAIVVPSMIELEKKKLGTKKGLPTIILVGVSLDNIFSISIIYLFITLIFDLSTEISLMRYIVNTLLQIIGGIKIGLLVGIFCYYIPKTTFGLCHTIRTIILIIGSFAIFFTFRHYSLYIAGPISVLSMTVFISIKWKEDNQDKMNVENKSLSYIWKFIFEPLLFLLIGYEMELNQISTSYIIISLIFIGIGILARIVTIFFITLSSHLSILEGIYSSIAFIPKATVQAAIVPFVYEASLMSLNKEVKNNASIVLLTCIISIFLTAPIGKLLLLVFSRLCLTKEEINQTIEEDDENGRRTVISNPVLGHWPNHISYPVRPYYTNVYFPGY